ncbi:hypothetical protein BC739_004351 [Kutzneria viridogrisea]|uniref:Uncharacterized protein n=1 Tax=Kutzneria viridogrisea TaxID=47990 RepID=A0ABR6BJT6_9PSEU|nr:hypothetical protein [Kutzneria viridogrisea]
MSAVAGWCVGRLGSVCRRVRGGVSGVRGRRVSAFTSRCVGRLGTVCLRLWCGFSVGGMRGRGTGVAGLGAWVGLVRVPRGGLGSGFPGHGGMPRFADERMAAATHTKPTRLRLVHRGLGGAGRRVRCGRGGACDGASPGLGRVGSSLRCVSPAVWSVSPALGRASPGLWCVRPGRRWAEFRCLGCDSRSGQGESRPGEGESCSAESESRFGERESRLPVCGSRCPERESRSEEHESRSGERESRLGEGKSRPRGHESRCLGRESWLGERVSRYGGVRVPLWGV